MPDAKALYDHELARIDRCQTPVTKMLDAGAMSPGQGLTALALQVPHALNHAAYSVAVQVERNTTQLNEVDKTLVNMANALEGILSALRDIQELGHPS